MQYDRERMILPEAEMATQESGVKADAEGKFSFNIVVRQVFDEGRTYFVSECLELPGCVADGDTPEEANQRIEPAIRACLSVIFEDAMEQASARRPLPDLTDIVRQTTLTVGALPLLECA